MEFPSVKTEIIESGNKQDRLKDLRTGVIFSASFLRTEQITPVLNTLHGLPVTYRIDFKVLMLVY